MEGIKVLRFLCGCSSFIPNIMLLSIRLCPDYICELLYLFFYYFQGGNKARAETNLGSRSGSSASIDTVSSSQEHSCLDEPGPASNSTLR